MPFFTGNVQGGEELIGGDVPGTTAAIAAEDFPQIQESMSGKISEDQLSSDSDFQSEDSEPFDLEGGDNNSNGEDEWKNVPNLVRNFLYFFFFI